MLTLIISALTSGECTSFKTKDYLPVTPFIHQLSAEFELVDVAILSNLKYFHADARQHHDWTLKNVFMLPIVNPHSRKNVTGDALMPGYVMDAIKVGVYVEEHLTEAEGRRLFPVKLTK
jgi:hypothetical protein